jgi:cobaltochelatase CobS
VDDAGNPIVPVMPDSNDASRIGQSTIGKLFGFKSKYGGSSVALWNASDAPDVDPYYVPEASSMAKFVTAAERKLPRYVWLAGPAGTGKTTLPMQYAAHTKRPFVRIAFQRATEPTDLIGMLGLDGKGGMKWRDGVLTKAIRKPGTVILLDEITLCPAGIAAILQTLLDMRFITLPTGEVVHCADGVVFCAADNTRGFGDDSGLYTGTTQSNAAMVDRFSRMVVVNYLPADQESQALANRTGAPRDACDRVVGFINSARKLPGFDARPLSLRRMVAFVEMVNDGFKPAESFEDTMLTRLPDAEFEALRQHFKAVFVCDAFEAELSGKPVPAISDSPQQVAAKGIFTEVQGS